MSLKGFHIIFIICAIILAVLFSVWSYSYFAVEKEIKYIISAVVSMLVAVFLMIYEINFTRKTKELR